MNGGIERLLRYFAKAARREETGWVCFRYVKEIARELGCDRRTVQRWLRRLEAIGAIRTEPTFHRHGGNGPNRYWLRFRPEAWRDRPVPRAAVKRLSAEEIDMNDDFYQLAKRLRPEFKGRVLSLHFEAFRDRYADRDLSLTGWMMLWAHWIRKERFTLQEILPYLRRYFRARYGDLRLPTPMRQRLRRTLQDLRCAPLLDWIRIIERAVPNV